MNAVWVVFKEHIKNFYLIQRLAQFQLKISNTNNYLGMAWELINPLYKSWFIGLYLVWVSEAIVMLMVCHLFIGYLSVSACGSLLTKVC